MTSDAKLLPCPFCGGEAKVYGPVGWYRQYGISHSCRVFYGGSGDFTLGAKTEEEAIAQWNRRSDLCASGQQVRAALEGAVNWLDALLALVQETSCDPDDPEAFDEVVMAAGMWLSRARAALITPTEGGSDAE